MRATFRKGSAGGMYRYYTCSTTARMGKTGCSGLSAPMDKLDRAVADHLKWRILDPQRLTAMMDQLLERREEWTERRRGHITELRKRQTEAEAKLKRLYEAIENGLVNMADPSLKGRIAELTAIRDQSLADADRAVAAVERPAPEITPESLKRFALAARRKIKNEDGKYRRDHLRALTQRVEVVSKSLMGSKTELLFLPRNVAEGRCIAIGDPPISKMTSVEMRAHSLARLFGISRADRFADSPMLRHSVLDVFRCN